MGRALCQTSLKEHPRRPLDGQCYPLAACAQLIHSLPDLQTKMLTPECGSVGCILVTSNGYTAELPFRLHTWLQQASDAARLQGQEAKRNGKAVSISHDLTVPTDCLTTAAVRLASMDCLPCCAAHHGQEAGSPAVRLGSLILSILGMGEGLQAGLMPARPRSHVGL